MKKIEILGTGCSKCEKLAEMAEQAAKELGIEYELVKVKQLKDIMNYGVMITPALVVNGEVKVSGKIPDISQIKEFLN